MEPTTVSKITNFVTENAVKFSFQVIGGIVILLMAWILSHFAAKFVHRTLHEKKVDITIKKFLTQTARLAIVVLGILFALSAFGIQIAPLVAGLSVAGVGVGLALQGPLSNYASGITLIFTKPFKVGDIIEVGTYQGEVTDIALPRTELLGLDGSQIIIPNRHIIGEVIKNFSEFRKLEFNINVSYDTDVQKALKILEKIITTEERIPSREKYKMGIKEFADSSVNLQAFVWVPQENYVDVKFAINNSILKQFKEQGINIPFPQRDVHIYQK